MDISEDYATAGKLSTLAQVLAPYLGHCTESHAMQLGVCIGIQNKVNHFRMWVETRLVHQMFVNHHRSGSAAGMWRVCTHTLTHFSIVQVGTVHMYDNMTIHTH